MKTLRSSLLMLGWLSLSMGCQPEETLPTPGTGLETRGESLTSPVGSWSTTASAGGSFQVATLMRGTGDVLTQHCGIAYVYNPYTDTWRWSGTMSALGRCAYTLTELPSGKVLAAGGDIGPKYSASRTELYDPATSTWSTLPSTLSSPRYRHTATLLDSGQVLLVGGYGYREQRTIQGTELYTPETDTWSIAGSTLIPRSSHTATLLYSGKVLVAGGEAPSLESHTSAEIYDPATNTWTLTASMARARKYHLAVRLYSGNVMVLGDAHPTETSVEMFDPYNERWFAGPPLPFSGAYSATMLYSGEVLVTGSFGRAAVYDPSTNTWLPAATRNQIRAAGVPVLLHTGQVQVFGPNGLSERFTR
ncbi:hypothetical protein JRI60_34470 [Archangium violaceum]|uniref:Kelch repeat-containing protein n=1 Tax=Archangium violaceum TaxID=83451 RepID=UPI00194F6DE8|nr:kelch repeat-containing protein [Archangium violaceum]QRN94220.1 hypothetical protein JRI60_34470 [Archangium violaceum]